MSLFHLKQDILSAQQLKRLAEHKYSSSSSSLLDTFFQPWWEYVVSLVPRWVAPNLITIIGLFLNIATSVLLMYYCPTATEEAPSWITFACAVGLFVYQTLDAIDGRQARRTGNSSPLGELFDHGCDSLSTVFVSVASACCVGLGRYPSWMMFQCFCASILFYCAHWQTYVTGTMKFGMIDVTEGQICVIFVMLLTSICGASVWDTQLLGFLPFRLTPTLFGTTVGAFSLAFTLKTISAGGAGKNGSTVAGTSVLTPAIPLALVIIPGVVIANKSEDLYFENPILYIITFGLIAAKITNKLVVAHMTKSEMHYRDSSLLAPLLLFLNQYFNTFFPEFPLLVISFIWVVLDLLRYCSNVCLEICDSLNVYLFKINISRPRHSTNGGTGSRSSSASRITRNLAKSTTAR